MNLENMFPNRMRVQEGHAHAEPHFRELISSDYFVIAKNILQTRQAGYKSLTAHLPLEVQHASVYDNLMQGLIFIKFSEIAKRSANINLQWENAPLCKHDTWDLKHGQTMWYFIPTNIDLCLDTGHLMLGASSINEGRKRIERILSDRGEQIKHLHVHVNNLISDLHITDPERVREVLGKPLLEKLTEGRTYIYEIPSSR
jgi:hypothetical protein